MPRRIGRLLAAVLAACCCLELAHLCNAAYLEMHPDFSPPPGEPTDPVDMVYTSPANERALLPYLVLLKSDSGELITDNVVVTATTIPEGNGVDTYSGSLCRRSKRHYSIWPPRYYDSERIVCLSNTTYPLGYVQNMTYDGVARFQNLLHTRPTDGTRRQLLFIAEYNGTTINTTTYPITVHPEGAKLEIVQPTSFSDVYVNEPQTVVVQTMMENASSPSGYSPLTIGRHSQLHVDLTISYDSKEYARIVAPGYGFHFQSLVTSSYKLGGRDVTLNAKEDLRIRKRCVAGMATFEDVRILTLATDVHLNITQTQPYWPWVRVPFHYGDALDFPEDSPGLFQVNLSASYSPGVAVSSGFNVLAPTPVSLNFSENVLDGFEDQVVDANLPFKKDISVEIHDVNGWVITDGPDASLAVVVWVDPSTACLSNDAGFKLMNGVGVFLGSICELGQNIRIQFSVTTSLNQTLYTDWTPLFNVTGEVHVAYFGRKYGTTMNTGFFWAAADLINDGLWDDEVGFDFSGSGRKLVGKTFLAPTPGTTHALNYYRSIRAANADVTQRSYSAIVGSYDEESTAELSTVSQLDKMPVIGYTATSDDLGLKDRHKYFSRVNSNDEAQFFTLGQWLQRSFLTKVMVLRSSKAPVPAAFYNGMAASQIEVLAEVVMPTASSTTNFTGLPPLDKEAMRIKTIGTKVLIILVDSISIYYTLHEAMRLGFACSDGYQWITHGTSGEALPHKNQVPFCQGSLGKSCTDAMRGLVLVFSLYLQSLDTGYWANTLFHYYVRRDPYETFTHQYAMGAPSLVGASVTHDALLAIFHGIISIIKRNETIHGETLNLEIRKSHFMGGSGELVFSSVGNRLGCELALWNEVPIKEYPDNENEAFYFIAQLIADHNFTSITEKYNHLRKLNSTLYVPSVVEFAAANRTNTRRFEATILETGEAANLSYAIGPPFSCPDGCGGALLSNDSVFYYAHGTCVEENTCECKLKENSTEYGYGLNNCSKVLCNPECKNGYCATPDNCQCDPGWSDVDCGTALCNTYGCDPAHGRCTFPDSCNCDPGYWSRDCSQPCSCQQGVCIEGQTGTGTCSECDPGYFGVNCDQQCTCNSANGNCSEGITGDGHCDACWEGYFGMDCEGTCTCDNGMCDSGPNGEGTCLVCQPGYFGSNCQALCSCLHGVCDDGPGGSGTCATCDTAWAGTNCELPLPAIIIPGILLLALVLVLLVLFGRWYYKRMRFRAELASNDWIIDYNDVVLSAGGAGAASSVAFRSMVSMASDQMKKKDIVKNMGKWNGIDIVLKSLEKESVPTNMVIRLEVKAMRDLRHHNIVNFVGCCVEAPNVAVLMELAPKGSLDDLLTNEAVKLDWNFKYSLLKDICRGMVYLSASPIKSHGRLKSSNCVVDNRWTLKLTDFGLLQFKANQCGVPAFNSNAGFLDESTIEAMPDNSQLTQLLWTAPELLKTGVSHLDHVGSGTVEGDMYSLAMIMVEMLTHDMPFSDLMNYIDIADVLRGVAGVKNISSQLPQAWDIDVLPTSKNRPPRPELPEDTDKSLKRLIGCCWAEDSAERPSFSVVLKEFNTLCPKKGDLMDNLVSMLEQYSTNLEGIVTERTAELAAEKQKTEDLVCRMLPKQIAEQLKQGQTINAESFDCVTIYFSDIVGFTKIAGASTPFQVVDLLNDLYTCFDSIIDHFDVYKVETIGDAYMVVSGLPQRNGDNHAGEIATMSLHLLSAMTTFTIRHLPGQQLQLRIGMHSGPCVAGVVGLKMPRYCLFGDTVNTASRMESGGMALRIHMSDSTAEILKRLGDYDLECRGEREVKGKGMMTTYWLVGKKGYNKPLPTEDMMASASQHEFK